MALPADDVDEVGHDRVVADQRVEDEGERPNQHDDGNHPQEGLPVQLEHLARRRGCEQSHDHADKDRHHRVRHRTDGDQHHAQRKGAAELVDEIEGELRYPHRGLRVLCERYRRVAGIEPVDDSVEHFELIFPSPLADLLSQVRALTDCFRFTLDRLALGPALRSMNPG